MHGHSDLRASLSGKSTSEADQARFDSLEKENAENRDKVQDLQDKIQKMKAVRPGRSLGLEVHADETAREQFIRDQDKLLRKAEAAGQQVRAHPRVLLWRASHGPTITQGNFEDLEQDYKQQISQLKEALDRQKVGDAAAIRLLTLLTYWYRAATDQHGRSRGDVPPRAATHALRLARPRHAHDARADGERCIE